MQHLKQIYLNIDTHTMYTHIYIYIISMYLYSIEIFLQISSQKSEAFTPQSSQGLHLLGHPEALRTATSNGGSVVEELEGKMGPQHSRNTTKDMSKSVIKWNELKQRSHINGRKSRDN